MQCYLERRQLPARKSLAEIFPKTQWPHPLQPGCVDSFLEVRMVRQVTEGFHFMGCRLLGKERARAM